MLRCFRPGGRGRTRRLDDHHRQPRRAGPHPRFDPRARRQALASGHDDRHVAESTLSLVLNALGDSLLGPTIAESLGLPRDAARELAAQRLRHRLEMEHPRLTAVMAPKLFHARYGPMRKLFQQLRDQDFDRCWAAGHLCHCRCDHPRLGRDRPDVPLFRHVAADHQHRYDHRHLPDGIPHPEQPEPRRRGDAGQARRALARGRQGARAVHRHRAPDRSADRAGPGCTRTARKAAQGNQPEKQQTAPDTVDRLLDRF